MKNKNFFEYTYLITIYFIFLLIQTTVLLFIEKNQILFISNNNIIENFNSDKIPKIIWGYWNTGIDNAPYLVKQCIKNWKKYNPTWEINILDDSNLEKYIDLNEFKEINVSYAFVKKKADLIRCILLDNYGGIWMDSSIFLTESLDWILKLQIEKNVEVICFYQEIFTTNIKYPVIENWFIASTKGSKLIKLWKEDFKNYLKIGYNKYIENIKLLNINTQNIDNFKYLTMHVSAQKILQLNNNLNIHTIPSGYGPFKYNIKYNWDRYKTLNYILFEDIKETISDIPKIIKFRGSERRVFNEIFNTKKQNKNIINYKYLNL